MAIDIQAQHAERDLPSPGGVAQKVLQLLSHDDTTLGALAHALAADPVMAGRVIRLANSAVYGGQARLVAIPDALQRVGLSTLRQVLVSFGLVDRYRQGHCQQFDYQAFWAQSLATAVAARHLAALMGLSSPGECFTLGLLARVGELALATLHPDDYGVVHCALASLPVEHRANEERTRYATDRFALAERLLRAWALPDSMALAVRACGEPARAGLLPHSPALRVARLLQVAVVTGSLFENTEAGAIAEGLHTLQRLCQSAQVPLEALDAALPDICREWREWAGALDLILTGSGPTNLIMQAPAEVIAFPQPAPARRKSNRQPATDRDPALHVRPVAPARPVPLRIVIAHADGLSCHSCVGLLRSQGHEVRLVGSGDAALRLLLEDPAQLLLCDLRLRQMDALSLCRAVRSSHRGRENYLMASAPRELIGALESAFGAGFDDFLPAPIQSGELLARLRAARRFIDLQAQARADAAEVQRLASQLAMTEARLASAQRLDTRAGPGADQPAAPRMPPPES